MNRSPNQNPEGIATQRVSLAGYLMVASSGVQDPIYARSVCIVVEHTRERSVGIMLNRRLAMKTDGLWNELLKGEGVSVNPASHINFGGPLDGPLLAIHNDEELAEGGNNQGVFLSAHTETLKKLALATPTQCRLFIGNIVWASTKLESEIVNGDWHVLPAIPELVFCNEQTMWQNAIHAVADCIISSITGIEPGLQNPERN